MKKLMIAVAIVCAAAISQAATYNWNAVVDYVEDTSAFSDGDYLNAGLKVWVFDALAGYDKADIVGLIAQGKLTDEKVKGAFLGDGLTEDYGAASIYGAGATGNATDDAVSAFLVIFNNEDASKASQFFASNIADGTVDGVVRDGGNASINFGDFSTDSVGGWQNIQSVPEPTSGLLLLLGVAGLALRRRRA